MKYKGKEIGYRPTLSMVKEFIKKKGYDIDANDFFKCNVIEMTKGYVNKIKKQLKKWSV